jgi:ribosomal protein L22
MAEELVKKSKERYFRGIEINDLKKMDLQEKLQDILKQEWVLQREALQRRNKMAEDKKTTAKKSTPVVTPKKESPKVEKAAKPETKENAETKKETSKTQEKKVETKVETKKETKVVTEKKEKAIANAYSAHISPKQSKFVCKMIKRKSPEKAIELLEGVIKGKVPVKMTGLEVAHQKGKGISGARFPKTAAKEIMEVIKQLKANATVNGIEEPVITLAISNQASAPYKKGGRKAKRTHLHFEVREKTKQEKQKK